MVSAALSALGYEGILTSVLRKPGIPKGCFVVPIVHSAYSAAHSACGSAIDLQVLRRVSSTGSGTNGRRSGSVLSTIQTYVRLR